MAQKSENLYLLFALFFSIGAIAVVLQTVLLREFLVVFSGNELSVGMVFACWLFGVTAGAMSGTYASGLSKTGRGQFFATLAFLVALPVAIIYFVRVSRGFFDIPPGQLAPFFDLLKITFLPLRRLHSPSGSSFRLQAL